MLYTQRVTQVVAVGDAFTLDMRKQHGARLNEPFLFVSIDSEAPLEQSTMEQRCWPTLRQIIRQYNCLTKAKT